MYYYYYFIVHAKTGPSQTSNLKYFFKRGVYTRIKYYNTTELEDEERKNDKKKYQILLMKCHSSRSPRMCVCLPYDRDVYYIIYADR